MMIIALLLAAASPSAKPHHHYGWDGRRYRSFCEGSRSHPRRNDPWLKPYLEKGDTVKDAQIELSDNRNSNDCGKRQ